MKVVFGLGNPGRRYDKTRHNLGFMLLDRLALKYDFSFRARLFKASIAEGIMTFPPQEEGKDKLFEKVVMAKPQTYMNLSGESVVHVYKWYKAELSDIIVICDDFSLPAGSLRFRAKGGSGGHNGLKSIINLLGTQDFPRLRIGIGTPVEKPCEEYVLEKISPEELKMFDLILDKGVEGIECFIRDGIEKAMSLYNRNFILADSSQQSAVSKEDKRPQQTCITGQIITDE